MTMTASRPRPIGFAALALAIGVLFAGPSGAVRAAGPCTADSTVLGQAPGLTGPTPTDWFNVFGQDFATTVPAVLTFDLPVIPWSIEQPTAVQGSVLTFTIPSGQMADSFKWTFRAADHGVQAIRVTVAGNGCSAVTRADFAPPPTSTLESVPVRSEPLGVLVILLVVFAGSGLAASRRHARRATARAALDASS